VARLEVVRAPDAARAGDDRRHAVPRHLAGLVLVRAVETDLVVARAVPRGPRIAARAVERERRRHRAGGVFGDREGARGYGHGEQEQGRCESKHGHPPFMMCAVARVRGGPLLGRAPYPASPARVEPPAVRAGHVEGPALPSALSGASPGPATAPRDSGRPAAERCAGIGGSRAGQ